jgi:hypothetical protein
MPWQSVSLPAWTNSVVGVPPQDFEGVADPDPPNSGFLGALESDKRCDIVLFDLVQAILCQPRDSIDWHFMAHALLPLPTYDFTPKPAFKLSQRMPHFLKSVGAFDAPPSPWAGQVDC